MTTILESMEDQATSRSGILNCSQTRMLATRSCKCLYDRSTNFSDYLSSQFTSSGGDWDVTPEMARDDADVTLFGLATNGVSYFSPVYDPFFAATMWDNGSSTLFYTANGKPHERFSAFLSRADQYT